jgi:MFS family permease
VRFKDVLRNRTFLVLYSAEIQSVIGDQLARVALSVLVFHRTGSVAATAATYAATLLPAIVGGPVLSGLADRFSRRFVMVACDLVRALLFAMIALPGVPLGVSVSAVVVAVFVGPVFTSAEVSLLAAALTAAMYRVGNGLRQMSIMLAQVVGFAFGGLAVAVLDPRAALALNAATFFFSAGLILLVTPRSDEHHARRDAMGGELSLLGVVRLVLGSRALWPRFGYSWLAGFFIVPEGLAVPYAHAVGASSTELGFMLAAIPMGVVLGTYVVIRLGERFDRDRTVAVMAMATGLPFLPAFLDLSAAWCIVLWALSGLFGAYQVDVVALVVHDSPDLVRARIYSLLVAGLTGCQGLGAVLFGLLGQALDVGQAITVAGAVGAVGAFGLVLASGRTLEPGARGSHRAGHATGHPRAATHVPPAGNAVDTEVS